MGFDPPSVDGKHWLSGPSTSPSVTLDSDCGSVQSPFSNSSLHRNARAHHGSHTSRHEHTSRRLVDGDAVSATTRTDLMGQKSALGMLAVRNWPGVPAGRLYGSM